MRILLACAAFPPLVKGGGAITSFLYAKALVGAGHEVRCVNVQGDEDRIEEYEGVTVHRLPSLNIYWNYYEPRPAWKKLVWHALENFNPRAFGVMRREIRDFRPDILVTISTENINVAAWAAARAEGIPAVHSPQSYFLMCWRGSMFRKGNNCTTQCIDCKTLSPGKRYLSQFVDGVHGETQFIVDAQLRLGYFANAITAVIPGGVDQIHEVERRIDGATLRVGFIGAHTPNKGIETIALAARRLSANANIEFVIAGSGDEAYTSQLKQLFPRGNTQFLGWVDPKRFFPAISFIVTPSLWNEPAARVMSEAMSYGVPVVGARSGGIPEIVQDGINGFVFTPGDADQLAAIIARLDQDRALLESLVAGAYQSIRRQLPEPVGCGLTAFYERVIARHQEQAGRGVAAE
jgi:glycosyltransferase involved in cell wall biosynthesis